jgi:hypothetical protein
LLSRIEAEIIRAPQIKNSGMPVTNLVAQRQ